MKKILPFLIATAISAFLFSCKDDTPYYDIRDEYIGDYKLTDMCDLDTTDYEITIYKADNSDDIVFGFPGLYQAGYEVFGIVTGMKLVIPIQQFYFSSYPEIFYEFTGSGSLEDTTLTIEYMVRTVQDGLIIDEVECRATMIR